MTEKLVDIRKVDLKQLPAWSLPHRFAVLPLEGASPVAPADVFTYGPLMADVAVVLKRPGVDWAAINAGIGLEWMNSLTSRGDAPLPPEEPQKFLDEIIETPPPEDVSDLELFLRRTYGLTPGLVHNWNIFGGEAGQAPPVPATALDAFVAERLPSATALFQRLGPYIDEAVAAGRSRRRVSSLGLDDLLREIAAQDIPFRPEVFRSKNGTPTGIGLAALQLHHRVLTELLDIFTRRPVLGICAACSRLFVPPRNSELYCRRYFWDARTFKLLRGCVRDAKAAEILANIDPREYRKKYERLSRAYSRAKEKFGADDPRTVERKQARDAWVKNAPREPGRPRQDPLPPTFGIPKPRSVRISTTTTPPRRRKDG